MDAPGVVDCSFLAPPEGVPISAVTVEMRIPALSAFAIIKKSKCEGDHVEPLGLVVDSLL